MFSIFKLLQVVCSLPGFVEMIGDRLPSTSKYWTMIQPFRAEAGLYLLHKLGEEASLSCCKLLFCFAQ